MASEHEKKHARQVKQKTAKCPKCEFKMPASMLLASPGGQLEKHVTTVVCPICHAKTLQDEWFEN